MDVRSSDSLNNQPAPSFSLTSVQGEAITLEDYQNKQIVIVWFSRGFTCPFCRQYMAGITAGYDTLRNQQIEVIQVAPNLLESARIFFRDQLPRFPFVCDPDKRLFARYGIGDRGVLEANRNTVISFSYAFTHGSGRETVRASWLDVANRNFLRQLNHHALTAIEQGIFIVDKVGMVRYQAIYSPLATIPNAQQLLQLVQENIN